MKITFAFALILLLGLTFCKEENNQKDSENANAEDSSEIEDILGDLEDPTRKKNCKFKVNCISYYSY